MFSPWMSRERLKLYLYSGRESYAGGEFEPPAWSNGISIYDRRIVAVYDQADRAKLMAVISHETTHLLFESYWSEFGRRPPSWLNEGLAMVEEGERDKPEKSDWFQAMLALPRKEMAPIEALARISPTQDLRDDEGQVTAWYIQSYSVVYFLLRRQSRLQFKAFCAKLRDGADLDSALWLTYRFKGAAGLEKAWLAWLQSPEMRAKSRYQMAASPAARKDSAAQPKRVGAIKGFKPLETPRR
jgi:hypothetical protein